MWHEGFVTVHGIKFYWEAKVFEEPSELGINDGRISKLCVKNYETNGDRAVYDRGWVLEPTSPEAETVLDILLKRFS